MQTVSIVFLAAVAVVNAILIVLAIRAFVAGMRGSVDSIADPE